MQTIENMNESQSPGAVDRTLPLLILLFVGSGCAALIYEVVWFQLLQYVIGSSAVSLAVLLGTFMSGMCLGSVILPRVIGPKRHPLRVYAALELGIAMVAIGIQFGLPIVDTQYAAHAAHGTSGIVLRALVAMCFLLPPTILMGATLPAVSRWVEATPRGVSWLGFFYGSNILGAVAGCLLAGFYLLRVYDLETATYIAASINVGVAVVAFVVGSMTSYSSRPASKAGSDAARPAGYWAIYIAIALSGLGALGAEVIWTRLLSLIIGGTVYTFAIILASFLIGLGVGSSAGARIGRGVNPRVALVVCQLLLTVAIAWAAYQISVSLPYWPVDPSLSRSPWNSFQLDLVRCLWAVLPAAVLWGASFPLALAGVAAPGADAGRLVGNVYAANTVGAIIGSLAFSILLVSWIGTERTQQILIVVAALSAVIASVPCWLDRRATGGVVGLAATVFGGVLVAGLLVWMVPETSGQLIAHGRFVPHWADKYEILYKGEGINSSVAVSLFNGQRSFHVSGKIEASSSPSDMSLQRMLGHLPALMHPNPKSVLVVGCGAGVTAGSFTIHPEVERIVICEIEPLIPTVVARYFFNENYKVIDDWRTEIVYDDARHYILTTDEKFDIITSDPIHPWVKGAATLYTKEYFEYCKARLNPGGIVSLWVPLYESNTDAVKSELATFFEVFPNGTIWGNEEEGEGYDTVLIGQVEPLRIDIDHVTARLEDASHALIAQSLDQVGYKSAMDLFGTYAGSARDLEPWLADAQINRDRNLRLQYLAGLGAARYQEEAIYREMITYRKYPEDMITASSQVEQQLRDKMQLENQQSLEGLMRSQQ